VRLWLIVVFVLVAACSSERPAVQPDEATSSAASGSVPVGSSSNTLSTGGMQRTYRLYRPATLPSPAPLVIMLHGAVGTGQQAESAYGWNAKADAGHFVVVYPDGYRRTWNAGGCCGPAQSAGVDDVGFITALVKTISAELPIDQSRIYATGMSNGGLLSYRLACDTQLFAAIGPVAATMLGSCPSPAPTSVIHIHGLADESIPYRGGDSSSAQKVDWPPVPNAIARWRAADKCSAPSTSRSSAVVMSVAKCPAGRSVELITIAGAGHQWPGSRPNTAIEHALGLDPPSTALDATATIWSFFAAHPKT
jgi:polyhydroxybutyrate depolymerase